MHLLHSRPVVVIVLLLVATTAFAAEIHTCRDASGQVSYSDRPCADDSVTQETRQVEDVGATAAGLSPACANESLDWQALDSTAGAQLAATLPASQQEAFKAVLSGLAYALGASDTRWWRARRGDLHFCSTDAKGTPVEMIAGANGELVSIKAGLARYLNDPNDPINVASRCSEAINTCYVPPQTSLERCIEAVPICVGSASLGVAACCPQRCKQSYLAARAAGVDPLSALDDILYGDGSCVTGADRR